MSAEYEPPATPPGESPAPPAPLSGEPPGSPATAPGAAGRALVTSTLVLYGALVLVAVVWGLLDGRRNIYFLPGRGSVPAALQGAAAGLALGLAVVLLSRMTLRWFAWSRRLHMEFHELLAGLTPKQALVLAAASAVGEEALFRGAVLPTLGLGWSAALFGAAHVPVRRGLWPWPFMAFGMGLAFGWMQLRFGDLTGPILAHATINYLNLLHIARHRL